MAYCKNCGNFVNENAYACTQCGAIQSNTPATVDNGGFGWGLLGCCIPLVGLILFLVWKDNKPVSSKQAGIGAAIGFGLNLLTTIIFYAIGIAASM